MTVKRLTFAPMLLLLFSAAANAVPIAYNFSWSGPGGWSMTGNFTYDSASAGDGAIRDAEVTSLFFAAYQGATLMYTNSTAHTLAGFNFNFNSATGQFFLGGSASTDTGQQWNYPGGSGLGFVAGSISSNLTYNQVFLSVDPNPSSLTATLARVPEPGTLALLGLGLLGLGLTRRKAA